MARSRTVEAPATSDVYFGMVLCSFFAILVAVGLLVLELTGTYGWETTPAALASPNLPKVPAREAAKAEGGAQAPVNDKPIAALTPNETPAPVEKKPDATAKTDPVPAATPSKVLPPGPIPSTLTINPKPATPSPVPPPVPTSTGPTPGFQLPKR